MNVKTSYISTYQCSAIFMLYSGKIHLYIRVNMVDLVSQWTCNIATIILIISIPNKINFNAVMG